MENGGCIPKFAGRRIGSRSGQEGGVGRGEEEMAKIGNFLKRRLRRAASQRKKRHTKNPIRSKVGGEWSGKAESASGSGDASV